MSAASLSPALTRTLRLALQLSAAERRTFSAVLTDWPQVHEALRYVAASPPLLREHLNLDTFYREGCGWKAHRL